MITTTNPKPKPKPITQPYLRHKQYKGSHDNDTYPTPFQPFFHSTHPLTINYNTETTFRQ